jgi:hypothetical protein
MNADVYLYQGAANPADVVLRPFGDADADTDATVQPSVAKFGYKPSLWLWRTSDVDERFRNKVEATIADLDRQIAALDGVSVEGTGFDRSTVIEPELLGPGWRRNEREVRHVRYDFASDLDPGVRRKIVTILEDAEGRKVNLYGSQAFRQPDDVVLEDRRLVRKGTNAWVLELHDDARLDLARRAVADGFKLVSFDEASLVFVHKDRFPWKPLAIGTGIGIGIGWLIWRGKA